jgi:hypothetical protein
LSLRAEIMGLRQDFKQLPGKAEMKLARRYGRLPPLERLSLYRRSRRAVGWLLRRLGLRSTPQPEPWVPLLKHPDSNDEARPLVIWALGMDRETLRTACRGFETLQASLPHFVPVLVTDVADFAFFSRLGWLVEYVPSLSAPAGHYAERKRQYLAWRYRDAPVLPATAGLRDVVRIEELLID